jgi:Rrf2 family iron-sulfur cluster assembly transcriptional regulator
MQITTKGRYAITAMLDLAINSDSGPINLNKISERQNISLSYLEQLFAKLRKSDLVKSIRGPGGGYSLNKQTTEINISEIIEAVDENVDLRRCAGKGNCNNGRECISHGLWCEVSGQIRNFLAEKTLAHVITDYNNK